MKTKKKNRNWSKCSFFTDLNPADLSDAESKKTQKLAVCQLTQDS